MAIALSLKQFQNRSRHLSPTKNKKCRISQLKSAENSNSIFTSASLLFRLLIYISVAGAIVLPSYVTNDNFRDDFVGFNKAKEVEARNHIGAIDRAQQAYYEKNNR